MEPKRSTSSAERGCNTHSVILSSSGAQKEFVEQLCVELEACGRSVFFDKWSDESLTEVELIRQHFFEAIQQCQVGVVVLSEEFFHSEGPMLELVEMSKAMESSHSKLKILPVFLGISRSQCDDKERWSRWLSVWRGWARDDPRIKIEELEEAVKLVLLINGLTHRKGLWRADFRKEILEEICKEVPPFITWDDWDGQGGSRLSTAAFDAMREDVSSRIKGIEASCTSLEKLLTQVEICPAQCLNLVGTCFKGTKQMIERYLAVSKSVYDMWTLYRLKKLRYLTSSLDRLLSTLESIENLLEACGSRWCNQLCRMALPISAIPLPPPGQNTFTEFDVLLKELGWNLDTANYALDLREDAKLNWNEEKSRYVLEGNHGTGVAAAWNTEAVEYGTSLFRDDRDHLLLQTKVISERMRQIALLIVILGTTILFSEDVYSLTKFQNKEIYDKLSALNAVINMINFVVALIMFVLIVLYCLTFGISLFYMRNYRRRSSFSLSHLRLTLSSHGGYFVRDVLIGRLEDSGVTSSSTEPGTIPACFRINHLHLDIGDELSVGDLKAIYRGTWRGQRVVIGVTKRVGHGIREIQEEIERQAALMWRVQHPNVVGFYGYAFTDNAPPPVSTVRNGEPVPAGYLVMELMEGDLRREIDDLARKQCGRPFPDDVAVDILLQIAAAMSHMHDCGVLYRDLKAKNCVVSRRSSSKSGSHGPKLYTVKLIDFDISKMLLDQDSTDHSLMRGSDRWMAPEVWGIDVYVPGASSPRAAYDTSVDVYSFGMTCYEVITGLRPFEECKRNYEVELALRNERRPVLPQGIICPRALEKLMSRCWAQRPCDRPDFRKVVKKLWKIKYELELQ